MAYWNNVVYARKLQSYFFRGSAIKSVRLVWRSTYSFSQPWLKARAAFSFHWWNAILCLGSVGRSVHTFDFVSSVSLQIQEHNAQYDSNKYFNLTKYKKDWKSDYLGGPRPICQLWFTILSACCLLLFSAKFPCILKSLQRFWFEEFFFISYHLWSKSTIALFVVPSINLKNPSQCLLSEGFTLPWHSFLNVFEVSYQFDIWNNEETFAFSWVNGLKLWQTFLQTNSVWMNSTELLFHGSTVWIWNIVIG